MKKNQAVQEPELSQESGVKGQESGDPVQTPGLNVVNGLPALTGLPEVAAEIQVVADLVGKCPSGVPRRVRQGMARLRDALPLLQGK